jgi:hypothetical protein
VTGNDEVVWQGGGGVAAATSSRRGEGVGCWRRMGGGSELEMEERRHVMGSGWGRMA